ncbi:hypothetical protein N7492_005127 [Penicillium capsulatum]|uniref:Uncharacterized protein n=1 Tax=Penicillium capsulatum TaxID=69766 RepID=A0A9W9IB29_9EURO|nr:hypothetical protein N7492_005127 [Penicillium capsulatum]KAJ6135767.1 hypothetical protein N7512_000927 [Penicillium capsulatum]
MAAEPPCLVVDESSCLVVKGFQNGIGPGYRDASASSTWTQINSRTVQREAGAGAGAKYFRCLFLCAHLRRKLGKEEYPVEDKQAYKFSSVVDSHASSATESPGEQATCIEREHYPIFDPEDPRHITWEYGPPQHACDSHASSSESQKPTHRIQDLPMRSLHKARSGIIALGAGIFRRSARQGADQSEGASPPPAQDGHKQGHAFARTTLSGASTQEDLSFGYELSRVAMPPDIVAWKAHSHDKRLDSLVNLPSVHALNAVAGPNDQQNCHEPAVIDNHRENHNKSAVPGPSQVNVSDCRYPEGPKRIVEIEQVSEDTRNTSDACLAQSASSILQENIHCFGEIIDEHQEFYEAGEEKAVPKASRRVLMDSEDLERGVETEQGIKYERDITNCSAGSLTGSFTLPDPEALSTLSSNTSRGQIRCKRRVRVALTEAFAKPEGLLPMPRDSFELYMPPPERSRSCSAEVEFAFPGVYQALVDQWVEDSGGNSHIRDFEDEVADAETETMRADQTSPAVQVASSHDLSQEYECHAHSQMTGTFDRQQACDSASSSTPGENRSSMNESTALRNPQGSPVRIGGHCSISEPIETSTTPTPSSQRHHSFGLHISLRNTTDNESQANEPDPQTHATDDGYSLPSLELGNTLGSLYDESDVSTSYTRGSTISADITAPTSVSSSAWSPLDSPIDEEVYFSGFFGNEYYMADGKTSSHHPDRGDLPVKASSRAMGDGSIYSGFGLDRASSYRTRERNEAMTDGTIRQARSAIYPAMRARVQSNESESAEDSTLEHQSQLGHLH